MKRRAFLAGLGASLGAVSTVSYFDMGASWKRHDDEVLFRLDGYNQVQVFDVGPAESILKEMYSDSKIASLVYRDQLIYGSSVVKATPGRGVERVNPADILFANGNTMRVGSVDPYKRMR